MMKRSLRFVFSMLLLLGLLLTAIQQDPVLQHFLREHADWAIWKIWLLPLFLWFMIMGFNIRKWKDWGNKAFFVIDVAFAGLIALVFILIHWFNHIISIVKGSNSESDPN